MSEQETPWQTPRSHKQAVGYTNAIGVLLSIHRTMPMQLAMTFLHVAADEGSTVGALAARCGVDSSVMSRHLTDLGSCNRHNEPGLALITTVQRIHGDRRERRVYLTEHGRSVFRRMIEELKRPHWRLRPLPHQHLREPKDSP
jgi:DNA-binding MarR family transcriptional regulator